MSGGSYNYLCYKDFEQLVCMQQEIEAMHNRLLQLNALNAAAHTKELLNKIQELQKEIDSMETDNKDLKGIWHVVEWLDSGDYGMNTATAILSEYEAEHEKD